MFIHTFAWVFVLLAVMEVYAWPEFTPTGPGTTYLPNKDNAIGSIGPNMGTYRFCGTNYDHMRVSRNGYVVFASKLFNIPPSYPVQSVHYHYDMAAIYWAYALGSVGTVSCRHSTTSVDKVKFKNIILSKFGYAWYPQHMIIITYLGIHSKRQPCSPPGCDLNDYQFVLGTKEVALPGGKVTYQTYVTYSYGRVEWTDAPDVMVGLNQKQNGDRYIYEDSFSDDVRDVTDNSPYAFRLDPRGDEGEDDFCFHDPQSQFFWDFA